MIRSPEPLNLRAVAEGVCERNEQWIDFGGFAPLIRAIHRQLARVYIAGYERRALHVGRERVARRRARRGDRG